MAISAEVRPNEQPAGLPESDLISRARRGDTHAWETLVRTHQEHIFRLAYLVLRDPAEAEDAAQETFIRAYLSLDTFESARPLRPWLTRIAVNVARNRRRSLRRYLGHLQTLLARTPEPDRQHRPPLDQALHQEWQANRLWQAVQRLNQTAQEVIYLRYFLDLSEAEMATALDVAPGTVKSRLHRALQKLRQVITADFPELESSLERK